LKTIATFAKAEEAHNLRAFLEANGIQAFVRDENTGASYSNAIGGVRVDVGDMDFERSMALYSSAPYAGDFSTEAESASIISQKTETLTKIAPVMNIDRELSVFRAIVKGIGVYQLVLGAEDLVFVILEKADIRHVPIGSPPHQGEYIVWAVFHFCVALVLLYGTDSFCRLAFPPRALSGPAEKTPNTGEKKDEDTCSR
jgi:hypothetical protein